MLSSTFATILFVFQCSMLFWLNPGMIVGTISMIKLIAHDWGLVLPYMHAMDLS